MIELVIDILLRLAASCACVMGTIYGVSWLGHFFEIEPYDISKRIIEFVFSTAWAISVSALCVAAFLWPFTANFWSFLS